MSHCSCTSAWRNDFGLCFFRLWDLILRVVVRAVDPVSGVWERGRWGTAFGAGGGGGAVMRPTGARGGCLSGSVRSLYQVTNLAGLDPN